MKIHIKAQKITVVLNSAGTIAEVESDYETLRKIFKEKKIKQIHLRADQLEEIDTAYFQLLLSLQTYADQREIPFVVSGNCGELDKIGELYGMMLRKEA